MRALFLLLVLANLGFLGWSRLVDAPRRASTTLPVSELPADVPRLILAREAPPRPPTHEARPLAQSGAGSEGAAAGAAAAAEGVAGKAAATVAAAPDLPVGCVSVGPFRTLPEAVQASAALRSQGLEPHERVEAGEIWIGHWVSLRGFRSREEANEVLQSLKQQGISDAYVLPGSNPPNVISLGVFSDFSRAERRQEQIRALGFEPELADRRQAGAVYWVDVDMAEPGQVIDPASLVSEPGRIVRLELRACPRAASAGATAADVATEESRSEVDSPPPDGPAVQ